MFFDFQSQYSSFLSYIHPGHASEIEFAMQNIGEFAYISSGSFDMLASALLQMASLSTLDLGGERLARSL